MSSRGQAPAGQKNATARANSQEQAAKPGDGRRALDDDDFKKLAQEADKNFKAELLAKSKPATEAPVTRNTLLEDSILLTDGVKFTLIPIGSILHLPEKLQSHVLEKPKGDFTFWPNFLKHNSSWLITKEVSLEMTKGDPDAAKAVLKEIALETHAVVAVHKGSPIMVLEATEEQPVPDAVKKTK